MNDRTALLTTGLLVGLTLALSLTPAWGEYQPKGKRDPFVPLLTSEGKRVYPVGTDEEVLASASGLALQGIVFDPNGVSYAVINGRVVRQNDRIEQGKVVRIEPSRVVVLIEGNSHELFLPKLSGRTRTKDEDEDQVGPFQGPQHSEAAPAPPKP